MCKQQNTHSTPLGETQERMYAETHLRQQNAPKTNLRGALVKS